MDCTQVLESDELDDSLAYKYKVKVAELKVNDNIYPIFSGSNRIGRDPEFCSVVFNNMTLSKEHAVIEVEDRFSHLIYDLGSKNKTRVGKTILKPHIRYQLLDKSQILLGDLLAEYLVIPEEQGNKPFAVIQESDDEVIPDTPVQSKLRESKESSSSREESPTIFQMETQCQLGYDELCMKKIVQDQAELEGNLSESSHPQDENKESSATGVSNTSMTASATGSSEVNVCEGHVKESTTELNHASDGDETDPEDVFFAMTQKRDESLFELSDKERSVNVKEMVKNGRVEAKDQVANDSSIVCEGAEKSVDHTNQPNTEKEEELLISSKEVGDGVVRAATREGIPETRMAQEQGREISKENEEKPKETRGSDIDETNGEGNSNTVTKELSPENESKNLFKVPLAADKEQRETEQTPQVILPLGEEMREREETASLNSDTDMESDDDSFFSAATQIIHQGNASDQEVFKAPLAVKMREQETDWSLESSESCDNIRKNQGTGVCTFGGKSSTTVKEDLEDSDSTTDDESSFFNAPTQVVHTGNEPTECRNMSTTSAELGKPTCNVSSDRRKICGKDGPEKEETVRADDIVMEADNSIFSAPTQVIHLGRKETRSDEKNVEQSVEVKQLPGTSNEICSQNDSIFEASTQIIHPENLQLDSVTTSRRENQTERKGADQKQRAIVPNSDTNKDDSIYVAEIQVLHLRSEDTTTFKTSTPAKKKSVMFAGISDGQQSSKSKVTPEEQPKEEGTGSNKDNESIFDAPILVMESRSKESSSCKGPRGDPKALKSIVPEEENRKQMSEHGITPNQLSSSSEAMFSNSPPIHPLDDSDNSIFSAPTQVISKPIPMRDSTSPVTGTTGKFNSSPSLGTNVIPKCTSQIVENNEEKTSSEQDSSDISKVSNRNEDALNESFFEAATQLYSSTALDEVLDSPNEDKANKSSLSRSSSYSSIHEAPTQCMDDLVSALDSEDGKGSSSAANGPETRGPSSEVQERREVRQVPEGNAVEEPLQTHETAAAAASSNANDSINLILPSSQELRLVGQECYGYISDEERPSTSNNTSSPVLQKRTRNISGKKGILMTKGLESIKPTVPSGPVSVKSLTDSGSKGQPDKQVKLPKERNDRKKTAGKKKAVTAKESDTTKKITDYLELNSARDMNAEQGNKSEENKTNDENETGRPLRQRKPTWKARESSQDGFHAAALKTKKGETNEQFEVSPGSSKQTKKHVLSPFNEVHIAEEDKNRKEKSRRSTKMDTESPLNSESKLEDSEKHSRKSENSDACHSASKQRNVRVNSLSPPQTKDEKTTAKKGVKLKRSIREANESKTTEHSSSSNAESKPGSNSPTDKRKQTSVDPSSLKKHGRMHLPLSSSDQDNRNAIDESRKGSLVSASVVELKAEEGMTRSRRKSSKVPLTSSDHKQDISPLHGNFQNEKVDTNKRGRSKRSTIDDSSANLVSKPGHGKMQQDNEISIASDKQGNTVLSSFSAPDKKECVGKRGGQKRTTTANTTTNSDIEAKHVKRVSPSSSKHTESIQSPDDKNKTVYASRRGRSTRSTTNSISSSEVETKSEGTRDYSSHKQRESSRSPHDQLDVRKRGRPKRSAASRASSVEGESKPVTPNKRFQDSVICDTSVKQGKTSVGLSSSDQGKNTDVGKRDRAKRSANKAFGLAKESNNIVTMAQEQRVEETNICDTPRKQRKIGVSSLDSGEVEIVGTNKRGRSKRNAAPSVPVTSKELTSTTNVISEKNMQPAPATPRSVKQRKNIVQSGYKTPSKANDVSEQEQSRRGKKGLNMLASDEDQSMCSSPLYGSSGRRRKVQSQTSSTESDGHSSQDEGTPKRSSRIKHHIGYHIMFTGVGCTGADETVIKKLGGKVVQEPEDCTILITDKIRRTLKFLCIVGQGKPIVTPDWIKQSHVSGHFLDPWNFIVKDKEAEKKYNFQLQRSLKEASAKKLLEGYSVFATPSVKPPPTEMKGIVENCGGHFLTKEVSPGKWPEKSFIISAIDDKRLCSKFKKSSVPLVSAEILLTGILQQKLNINDYILKL